MEALLCMHQKQPAVDSASHRKLFIKVQFISIQSTSSRKAERQRAEPLALAGQVLGTERMKTLKVAPPGGVVWFPPLAMKWPCQGDLCAVRFPAAVSMHYKLLTQHFILALNGSTDTCILVQMWHQEKIWKILKTGFKQG